MRDGSGQSLLPVEHILEKAGYATASFVGNNRVVFNIGGNNYRLIVAIAYRLGVVYVKFIGTHADYDKVDAATVEME